MNAVSAVGLVEAAESPADCGSPGARPAVELVRASSPRDWRQWPACRTKSSSARIRVTYACARQRVQKSAGRDPGRNPMASRIAVASGKLAANRRGRHIKQDRSPTAPLVAAGVEGFLARSRFGS
jgi:hypothetical protein